MATVTTLASPVNKHRWNEAVRDLSVESSGRVSL